MKEVRHNRIAVVVVLIMIFISQYTSVENNLFHLGSYTHSTDGTSLIQTKCENRISTDQLTKMETIQSTFSTFILEQSTYRLSKSNSILIDLFHSSTLFKVVLFPILFLVLFQKRAGLCHIIRTRILLFLHHKDGKKARSVEHVLQLV